MARAAVKAVMAMIKADREIRDPENRVREILAQAVLVLAILVREVLAQEVLVLAILVREVLAQEVLVPEAVQQVPVLAVPAQVA